MLVNCPPGSHPDDFQFLTKGVAAGVYDLNNKLARFKPQTLEEIASCYNAGHIQRPLSPGVQRYADDLKKHYQTPMP
jgi:hypothetical protein